MDTINNNLSSSTLIRGIYRALLNTSRTYAAFEERHIELLENLKYCDEIFDPMSGYGGLMRFCSRKKYQLSSYNVECNPPSYFWQLLMHPEYINFFQVLCSKLLSSSSKWPKPKLSIALSNEWFPNESLNLLKSLFALIIEISKEIDSSVKNDLGLAILLPFVGRLSTCIQGNVVINVKKGGLCVYVGWQDDFRQYIQKLLAILNKNSKIYIAKNHKIILGDARTIKIDKKKFSAMLTSPPYPNFRDYYKMFLPENTFLQYIDKKYYKSIIPSQDRFIGSSDVNEKGGKVKHTPNEINSSVAREFIEFIANYKGSKRSIYDNKIYYLPYYCNYFYGIEKAYNNIAKYLADNFEGYIIVVNNTARKKVVPVAKFIIETWEKLGFNAEIVQKEELTHVGGLNPKVKGLSARHMEYTIKVWRS